MSDQISVGQCLGDPGSVLPREKKVVDGETQYERLIDWQARALTEAGHLRTVPERLVDYLAELGASGQDVSLSVIHRALSPREYEWSVALEWGAEAPDSPMVAAASYGVATTLKEALEMVLAEVRR